jgi:hypothetical protein
MTSDFEKLIEEFGDTAVIEIGSWAARSIANGFSGEVDTLIYKE